MGRDGEPSAARRLDPIRVADALRREDRIAGLTLPLFSSDLEPELAFENVEDLVFVQVNVQRRRVASPRGVFEHRNLIAAIAVRRPHTNKRVEKPEILDGLGHSASVRFHDQSCTRTPRLRAERSKGATPALTLPKRHEPKLGRNSQIYLSDGFQAALRDEAMLPYRLRVMTRS